MSKLDKTLDSIIKLSKTIEENIAKNTKPSAPSSATQAPRPQPRR